MRRLSVRTLLLCIVLFPTVATAVVTVRSAASSWDYKSKAERVETDASRISQATTARVALEDWVFAAEGITYAWDDIGLTPAQVKAVIGVDFSTLLPRATSEIVSDKQLGATPAERAYQQQIVSMQAGILSFVVPFETVDKIRQSYENLVNAAWSDRYRVLLEDTDRWSPPGSFDQHVTVLLQTFKAYLDTLDTLLYANFILSGHPPPSAVAQYFAAAEGFRSETGPFFDVPGFPSVLGSHGRAAWNAIATNQRLSATQSFFTQLAQASVASGTSSFAGNLGAYEFAYSSINPYMHALGNLLHAESTDLSDASDRVRSSAAASFTGEIAFLGILVAATLVAALLLARSVSRPVRRLAEVATEVQHGVFAVEPLPERGPSELTAASRTFNEMVSTLRSLEEKTVALASEDLSDPVLQEPLPGRAGRALQRAVEKLTERVREREQERRKLEVEATTDGMTGLLNRSAVVDVVSRDLKRRSGEGDVVALIYVDLDGLKTINDSYGHDVGDEAIHATSMALRASTREGDAVARLGGDEFLVVAHVPDLDAAQAIADQITLAVAASAVSTPDGEVQLSCSTGVSVAPKGSEIDPLEAIRAADADMYTVKRQHQEERAGL